MAERQRILWLDSNEPLEHDEELIVDNFAGGGGASVGIEQAIGRPVDIAVNHDAHAIAMHRANHPNTRHYCESVFTIDPVKATRGRPVGLAWFSPDCTDFSKAKGGTPVRKKIRGLAWIVLRWAAKVRPRIIIVENVEEFEQWGPLTRKRGRESHPKPCRFRRMKTFRRWYNQLSDLGYEIDYRQLVAADYGAPTIRKRLFIVARCDGQPIVWPKPTHARADKAAQLGLLPWRGAAECIDWSLPCPSIFLSREEGRAVGAIRPLKPKTMARIANGIKRYVLDAKEPFIVRVNHGSHGFRGQSTTDPLSTVTGRHGFGLVTPFTVPRYGERDGQAPRCGSVETPLPTVTTTDNGASLVAASLSTYYGPKPGDGGHRGQEIDEPLRTQGTENRFALVQAFIAKHFGGMVGTSAELPFPTITSRGTQNQIVAANMTHLYSSNTAGGQGDPDKPLKTILTANHAGLVASFLAPYYGSGSGETGRDPREPSPTTTTKDRLQLVMVEINGEPFVITDIGMRMLTPRELFRCQGFPENYVIDVGINGRPAPKHVQVAACGNSVCPPVARAIVEANYCAVAPEVLQK